MCALITFYFFLQTKAWYKKNQERFLVEKWTGNAPEKHFFRKSLEHNFYIQKYGKKLIYSISMLFYQNALTFQEFAANQQQNPNIQIAQTNNNIFMKT